VVRGRVALAVAGSICSLLLVVLAWRAATCWFRVRSIACPSVKVSQVGKFAIWRSPSSSAFFFEAGMAIDADGAPDAYHPRNTGRDDLANAGGPGNWWALVTDERGEPVVQGPTDPMPGYYVSTTSLQDTARAASDPRRYVDAGTTPFVVLPWDQCLGAELGDFAVAANLRNGKLAGAILADLGPAGHLGEGSMALAQALGIDSDARHGGTRCGVVYVVFPGSGNGRPRSLEEIEAEGARLFGEWGGLERLRGCYPSSRASAPGAGRPDGRRAR
jgi:hypothetical protein